MGITRRELLTAMGTAVAFGTAGCAPAGGPATPGGPGATSTPGTTPTATVGAGATPSAGSMATAGAGATASPSGAPAAGALEPILMEHFMAVSALLTGFAESDLSPVLARTYLDSIERHHSTQVRLSTLYFDAGLSDPSVSDAERLGRLRALMKRRQMRILAERILSCWFSGLYDTDDGQKVGAWSESLAWRSVRWTFAPGQCHGFGDWSKPPLPASSSQGLPSNG